MALNTFQSQTGRVLNILLQEEMKAELAALLGAPDDMIVITAVYEEQLPVQR